jgi:hypothetical protein
MIKKGYKHDTLRDLLCDLIFEDNKSTFLIIYDDYNILSDFLNEEISNQTGFKLLSIQATQKPVEFLERIKIVEDFNEDIGWYENSWIIHVFGEYSREIESFGSFHYYGKIGKVIIIEDFCDFLMKPELNLVKSRDTNSLLQQEPSLNHFLLKYLVDRSISSYINTEKTFNESAAWMTLFTSNSLINPLQKTDSPSWISISQEKKLFSHEKNLLELIYWNDLIAQKTLDEKTINYLNKYFNELLNELQITILTLSEDWNENLLHIIQFFFHYGKSAFSKRSKGKKKVATLDAFLIPEKKEINIPQSTIRIFENFINDWLTNSDQILLMRFQQWMNILRKRQTSILIKQEEIQKLENGFSYTGIIDIYLASGLLESQQKKPLKKEEWLSKVSMIISNREKLWKNYARLWWKDRNLISFEKKLISIHQLWEFTLRAGLLLSFEITSSNWQDLQEIAWENENNYMVVMKPEFNHIFKSEDSFKQFLNIITILNTKYLDCQKKIESPFTEYYYNLLSSEDIYNSSYFSKTVWDDSINRIKENQNIGFIFCDALRHDLANELKQKIKIKWDQKKSIITEKNIEEIQSLSFLPSITNLGWSQILKKEDEIYVKTSNDNIISGIESKSEKKIFYNPKDRNSRILQILNESGKKVEILEIDLKNFKEQKGTLQQKINQNNSILVPILWYDKFDNHDLSFEEFIERKDTFLDELQDTIWKLHETGIEFIYILSDHGFIFVKNEDFLEDKPNGMLHKRYCLSPNTFTDEECEKYPNWKIFTPELLRYKVEDDKKKFSSIIVPLGYKIFKKSKKNTDFFLHGGLSFQECDLLHLKTQCLLRPIAELEDIKIKTHEKVVGQDIYYLKEMTDDKYLDFLISTKKKGTSAEPLRPITFKVICPDLRIQVTPKDELKLSSGKKRTFQLRFDKKYSINSIEIQFINPNNEIIKIQKISVTDPSIYGSESLF